MSGSPLVSCAATVFHSVPTQDVGCRRNQTFLVPWIPSGIPVKKERAFCVQNLRALLRLSSVACWLEAMLIILKTSQLHCQ